MRLVKKHFFLLFYFHAISIALVVCSCGSEGLIDQLPDGNQLVINGLVTNQQGFIDINISRTVPFLDSANERRISNAEVFVFDNLGDSLSFQEVSPGLYRSEDSLFSGVVGATYRLEVTMEDGEQYVSEDVILRAMGSLDQIRCLNCSGQDIGDPEKRIVGVINGLAGIESIYRWRLYKNDELQSSSEDIILIRPDASIGTISNHQITHRSFSVGDTVRIEQLSLTEGMFDFLSLVAEQSQGQSAVSPVLPANAIGNIRNLNDGTERVLGYFGASSVESKEIIILSGAF